MRDAACPISTGWGTRRVHSVRRGGGGRGGYRDGAVGGRREQHFPVARAAPRPRAVRPARGRRRRAARREHHTHDRAGVRLPGAAYRARSQIEHLRGARVKSQLCARSPSARDVRPKTRAAASGRRDQFRGGLGRDRELPRLGTEAQRVATHLQRRDVVDGGRGGPTRGRPRRGARRSVSRSATGPASRPASEIRAREAAGPGPPRDPRHQGGGGGRTWGTWRRRRGGGSRRAPRHSPRAPRAPRSGPQAARQPARRAQSGAAGAPIRGPGGQSARNQASLYKTEREKSGVALQNSGGLSPVRAVRGARQRAPRPLLQRARG